MCYNLILHWGLGKTAISAKHSYNLGAANGLIELVNHEQKVWVTNNGNQLVVADGKKVAKEYLNAQNTELDKGRKTTPAKDIDAYKDGKKASKKIGVRGKRLK